MSRRFKKQYSDYNREILSEFMTDKELNELDKKYNEAKMKRLQRKIESELKQ